MDLLKLFPVAVPKPWGGGHLDAFKNSQEASAPIGELVLASCVENFPVKINSPLGIVSFAEYWKSQARQKLGNFYTEEFPFMIKLLSINEPLSVQVHPADDDLAALKLSGRGKSEAWAILNSAADALAYLGLKPTHSFDDLVSSQSGNKILDALVACHPKPGEIYMLEAGLVHAAQGRIFFYEIQQASDHTFRIYDFGRGRSLDLDLARRVTRDLEAKKSSFAEGIKHSAFQLQVREVGSEGISFSMEQPYQIVTFLCADFVLDFQGAATPLAWGDSFLIWRNHQDRNNHMTIRPANKTAGAPENKSYVFIATKGN